MSSNFINQSITFSGVAPRLVKISHSCRIPISSRQIAKLEARGIERDEPIKADRVEKTIIRTARIPCGIEVRGLWPFQISLDREGHTGDVRI